MTLIYCAWLAPPDYISVDGPLTDCQLLLYIVTERYPSARKYRDVFERIKKAILDLIAQGKHEPRHPVHLEPVIQEGVTKFSNQWEPGGMAGMGNDFNFMINSMIGNPVTTPTFELGLDPTTGLVGGQNHQGADLGFPLWHTMPNVQPEMSGIDAMRGIFQ